MRRSTGTRAAVSLMGHLDVWAYVIQSLRAASNRPLPLQRFRSTPIDLRLASSTPTVMAQATGAVRVLRRPSHRLPPSAPTHTHAHACTQHCPTAPATPGLTLICLWRTQQLYPEYTDRFTASLNKEGHINTKVTEKDICTRSCVPDANKRKQES